MLQQRMKTVNVLVQKQIEEPHLNKEVREKYKELQQKYEDGNVR